MSACCQGECLSIWPFLSGICCPFNVTVGQVSRLKEKFIWVDLFPLAFVRHRFNHVSDEGGVEGLLKQSWDYGEAGLLSFRQVCYVY